MHGLVPAQGLVRFAGVGLADAAGARTPALVHIGCWFGNTFEKVNAARFGQMNGQFRFHGCIATKRGGK